MYIHLRDKSKPLPSAEECVRRLRKVRRPEDDDQMKLNGKEVKHVRTKTDGQKTD